MKRILSFLWGIALPNVVDAVVIWSGWGLVVRFAPINLPPIHIAATFGFVLVVRGVVMVLTR